MALKPCHECKQPVSTTATKCPHCGAPSKAMAIADGMKALGGCLTLLVTVPILLFVFGVCH